VLKFEVQINLSLGDLFRYHAREHIMNYTLASLAVLMMTFLQDVEHRDSNPPISLTEISERGVIGNLGVPLGTSVAIQAEIIDGRSLRTKSTVSIYLLRVTHIEGKKLERPKNMRFDVFPLTFDFEKLTLASSHHGFNKLLDEINEKQLTPKKRAAQKDNYVGKIVKLAGYETGGYRGIPHKLPDGIPAWPDTGFHFSPQLIILKSLE
jgi:hypothetical protein